MRKSRLLSSLMGAVLALPVLAQAAEPASPHTFTSNVSVVNDYRFRGISQTFGNHGAIQGGFDYSHTSGFYAGNWNSNVSETAGYPNGNLESDFYGGWKKSWGDYGIDVGLLEYYYFGSTKGGSPGATVCNLDKPAGPGQCATGTSAVTNTEIYIAGSWKWISLKYSDAVSDYFSVPGTKNSHYLDVSANYDLGNGWGVSGHVGRLSVKNFSDANYTDYKLGVTKDLKGFVFGASYIGTNARKNCTLAMAGTSIQPYCFFEGVNTATGFRTYEAGKGTAVLSVSRTF